MMFFVNTWRRKREHKGRQVGELNCDAITAKDSHQELEI
jgi:hypothetical protein